MTAPILIIDIREEHEVMAERVGASGNSDIQIVNIPMRHIAYNVDWINKMSAKMPVHIICASGNRSGKIKDKYFASNQGIKSFDGGVNLLKSGKAGQVDGLTVVPGGQGKFGMNQYMQMMFAAILLVIAGVVYMVPDNRVSLGVIATIVAFISYQLFSKSCLLSKLIPLN